MPSLVRQFAASQYHQLYFETYAPGGFTLNSHSNDNESITRIKKRNWQFIVLQEQSQLPSFPDSDVDFYVYPALLKLDSIISENSECSLPTFFRTWGRKNGDSKNCAVWPPVCTYKGMDSLLGIRYQKMADTTNGVVVPVGEVWKKVREQYPLIELYKPDESHPSVEGSYLAACCFYTVFFREDPTKSNYKYTLNDSTANRIKRITKQVVFNKLSAWNVGKNDPISDFEILSNENGKVTAVSTSKNAFQNNWLYGDSTGFFNDTALHGDTVTLSFKKSGNYVVNLQSVGCFRTDEVTKKLEIKVDPVFIEDRGSDNIQVIVDENSVSIITKSNYQFVSFFDLNGRLLSKATFNNSATFLSAHLPNMFIVQLRSPNGTYSKLIVR
ncbi:MAG: T9SS type A sorting domain-containing protein, partial [Bacteroidia bacterium]